MKDLEKIIIKEIIIEEKDNKSIAYVIGGDETSFRLLSKIIHEHKIDFERYRDKNQLAVFDIMFDDEILKYEPEKSVEENKMYMRLFEQYPDGIGAGWRSNGHYHLGDSYKLLSHS